jgi:hypothetical protein
LQQKTLGLQAEKVKPKNAGNYFPLFQLKTINLRFNIVASGTGHSEKTKTREQAPGFSG